MEPPFDQPWGEQDSWASVWAETNFTAGSKAEIFWKITPATIDPDSTVNLNSFSFDLLWSVAQWNLPLLISHLSVCLLCLIFLPSFLFFYFIFFALMGAVHSRRGQLRLPGKVRGHREHLDGERQGLGASLDPCPRGWFSWQMRIKMGISVLSDGNWHNLMVSAGSLGRRGLKLSQPID